MSHVLVVEDHADTCRLLTRLLHKAGHTVACAGNGREGTAALSGARTDVVVLDLMMPDMDGVEFLETIRSYARWRSLPVILVTGAGDNILVTRAQRHGVFRTFVKGTFDLTKLLAAIDEATGTVNAPTPG